MAAKGQFMGHVVEHQSIPARTADGWLQDASSPPFDVAAELSAALPPGWTVRREVDPVGDISIIVFPTCDDPRQSTFVLYEENGFVQVGIVTGETWRGKSTLPTCRRAVAAILSLAAMNLARPTLPFVE
jgi:hypothetical protein